MLFIHMLAFFNHEKDNNSKGMTFILHEEHLIIVHLKYIKFLRMNLELKITFYKDIFIVFVNTSFISGNNQISLFNLHQHGCNIKLARFHSQWTSLLFFV